MLQMKLKLWILGVMLVAVSARAESVVPLHPDLPDTLDTELVSRLALFPDLSGVTSVWFERGAWGGILAHLETRDGYLAKELERTVPRSRWLEMKQRGLSLLAGGANSQEVPLATLDSLRDSPRGIKAWPEVPVRKSRQSELKATEVETRYPSVTGEWLVFGGVGYQHNVSSYGDFMSDMAVFQLGFARALTDNILPCAGFTAGFGDLDSDYEDLVGDGRANNYSAMAGLLFRAPVNFRTSLYLEGEAGYFTRVMQWGEAFYDPATGETLAGNVRESGDWGYSVKLGVMLQTSHSRKARFLDFNLGLMWGHAEDWNDVGDEVRFTAEGDDVWLLATFRFWDPIQ